MRKLPYWIGHGAEVSDLAYQIIVVGFDDPPRKPTSRPEPADGIGIGHVVEYLAELLDVDEADVLRGLAELEQAGVLERA